MSADESAGDVFSSHIDELMKGEFERRQRLESRGQAITTTSAGLLTLFVGIATLMMGQKYHFSSHNAVLVICYAFGAFLLASAIGIATQNAFVAYSSTASQTLDDMVGEHWEDAADDAKWICAKRQVDTVKSLRSQNAKKARLALGGAVVQLVAIALLASGILTEVLLKL